MKSENKAVINRLLLVLILTASVLVNSPASVVHERLVRTRTDAWIGTHVTHLQDPPEISLILKNDGFNPAQVSVPNRRFLLSLDNRSGVSDLVLRLSKSDGTEIREMRIAGERGDWNEMFELTPGEYVLSEVNHSTWVCRLVVEAQ